MSSPRQKMKGKKSRNQSSVARDLGLPEGVDTRTVGDDPGGHFAKESARRALSLLKAEDHLWTIDEYVALVNDARVKNNKMKEQLLNVERNFDDHVKARDQRIKELEASVRELTEDNVSLKATLETDRASNRRAAVESEKKTKAEIDVRDQALAAQALELQELQQFKEEKSALTRAIDDLKAQSAKELAECESRVQQGIKRQMTLEATMDTQVMRAVAEKERVMRKQVEESIGVSVDNMNKENKEMMKTGLMMQDRLQKLLVEVAVGEAKLTSSRLELSIVRELAAHSAGRIKHFMRALRAAKDLLEKCTCGAARADKEQPNSPEEISRDEKFSRSSPRPETAPETNTVLMRRPASMRKRRSVSAVHSKRSFSQSAGSDAHKDTSIVTSTSIEHRNVSNNSIEEQEERSAENSAERKELSGSAPPRVPHFSMPQNQPVDSSIITSNTVGSPTSVSYNLPNSLPRRPVTSYNRTRPVSSYQLFEGKGSQVSNNRNMSVEGVTRPHIRPRTSTAGTRRRTVQEREERSSRSTQTPVFTPPPPPSIIPWSAGERASAGTALQTIEICASPNKSGEGGGMDVAYKDLLNSGRMWVPDSSVAVHKVENSRKNLKTPRSESQATAQELYDTIVKKSPSKVAGTSNI